MLKHNNDNTHNNSNSNNDNKIAIIYTSHDDDY